MWLALCFCIGAQAVPEAEDALFGHLRPGEKGAVLMVREFDISLTQGVVYFYQ